MAFQLQNISERSRSATEYLQRHEDDPDREDQDNCIEMVLTSGVAIGAVGTLCVIGAAAAILVLSRKLSQ